MAETKPKFHTMKVCKNVFIKVEKVLEEELCYTEKYIFLNGDENMYPKYYIKPIIVFCSGGIIIEWKVVAIKDEYFTPEIFQLFNEAIDRLKELDQ